MNLIMVIVPIIFLFVIVYFINKTRAIIDYFLGIFMIILIGFIPYRIWILFGSSQDWDGVYILGGSGLAVISSIIVFYWYVNRLRFNRSNNNFIN